MINEMGSPFEFAFKELLNGCKRMVNENHPESIFLFWGDYCYFQIDNEKKIFWLSHFDFDLRYFCSTLLDSYYNSIRRSLGSAGLLCS